MSLVRETCPHLVRRWELETRAVGRGGKTPAPGAEGKPETGNTGPGATPKTPTPRKMSNGIPRERSPTQHSIVAFLTPSKSKPAGSPGRASPPASTPRVSVTSVDSDGSEELAAAGLSPIPTLRRDLDPLGGVLPTTPKRKPSTEDVVDLLTPPTSPAKSRSPARGGAGSGGGGVGAVVAADSPSSQTARRLAKRTGACVVASVNIPAEHVDLLAFAERTLAARLSELGM